MYDPTETQLATLEPRTQLAAYWLIYSLRLAGAPAIVTSALRTIEEQKRLVAEGFSRTLRSKHLDGRAFDIDLHGWNRSDIPRAFWDIVGPWAEANLGLTWGGRWKNPYDPGHFESP